MIYRCLNEIESLFSTKTLKDQSAEIPISKRESPSFGKHQLIMSIMKINKLSNALINYQNNTEILTTTSSRKYIYYKSDILCVPLFLTIWYLMLFTRLYTIINKNFCDSCNKL